MLTITSRLSCSGDRGMPVSYIAYYMYVHDQHVRTIKNTCKNNGAATGKGQNISSKIENEHRAQEIF